MVNGSQGHIILCHYNNNNNNNGDLCKLDQMYSEEVITTAHKQNSSLKQEEEMKDIISHLTEIIPTAQQN